jgi:hypothetical protein
MEDDVLDRIETREVFAIGDIAWLRQNHEWLNLRSIVMVVSSRKTQKGNEQERRFYISSLLADVETRKPMKATHSLPPGHEFR